jgi:hypothetical protein
VDSVVTVYHYSGGKYTSAVFSLTIFSLTVKDSAVYTYDGSGKVTRDEHHQVITGFPSIIGLRNDYTYTGAGNLTMLKQSAFDPTTMALEPVSQLDYVYDNKTNPLVLKDKSEAIVILRSTSISSNNVLSSTFNDLTDPTNNFTIANVFTYNSSGKPLTAVSTQNPGATVSNVTYYYQ